MEDRKRIMSRVAETQGVTLPVIVCFFSGHFPAFATPMHRFPAPPVDVPFDSDFNFFLAAALECNPAVHDGAVMVKGPPGSSRVVGWSYRLFPPAIGEAVNNRGSAFNSCLAMSGVDGVDEIYLVTRDGCHRFVKGSAEHLVAGRVAAQVTSRKIRHAE